MNCTSIKAQENKFFKRKLIPELGKKGITVCRDGMVDEETWQQTRIKIVFLLKEPVADPNKPFSLTAFLKKGAKHKDDQTWRNVAQWVCAVQNDITDYPTYEKSVKPQGDTPGRRSRWLKHIVAVNVKKQGGESHTKTNQLLASFNEHFKPYLPEQLRLYSDADLIVCCGDGIWQCLKSCYEEAYGEKMHRTGTFPSKQYPKKYAYFLSHEHPCVLNFWHPSYYVLSPWYRCSKFTHLVKELLAMR